MRFRTLVFWLVAGWVALNVLVSIADAVGEWATDPAQGAFGLLAVLALVMALAAVPIVARRLRSWRPWLWWPIFMSEAQVAGVCEVITVARDRWRRASQRAGLD